ncbi:MAG: PQQ-dependent sugar dehydrogenase [Planctomycetaceae bacterium]|nr:PQQ-dependent sugar dehydrogenase [Planctomycetaceae bacterium]
MPRRCLHLLFLLLTIFHVGRSGLSAEERIPWTSSQVTGSPDPLSPYTIERVFPEVSFQNPVDFAVEPTTGRWFILQLDGKLFAFDPASGAAPQLVADMKLQVEGHNHSYGIEFHPDYANNGQLFWCYVLKPDLDDGSKVVRVEVKDGSPPSIDLAAQELLLTWPSGGHNGGCLKFGPDGMLYITTGDGTGPFPPDSADAGQNLADLRSTIMRIDVDHAGGGLPYSIPDDNPFLSLPEARPEVWAFGFRNPWKISFDAKTGELWCGDVGWELWELVFRVVRAGNYGWSLKEGRQPVRVDLPPGPGEIIPPVVDHLHTEARSITGGFVYYGTSLPDLEGAYLYGDYVTGKIWGLRNEGNSPTWHQELADTSLAIITFGLDADGELVIVDYAGGFYRLIPRPAPSETHEFPRKLSQTGLFASTADQHPAPGVLPYALNAEMFADGAEAQRWLAIPDQGSIQVVRNREHWKYPQDTVVAKTISLDNRNIETQILHFDGDEWRAYSYAWNEEQTDAELVEKEGRDLEIPQTDGPPRPWRIHSRAECLSCHMPPAGFTIGISLPNLNHSLGGVQNLLDQWSEWKVFANDLPKADLKTAMVDPYDGSQDLEARARSYLAINCAHCHRRQGGGTARIEFPFEHANDQMNAIHELPTQGAFGLPEGKIITPGDPYRSVLYYRLATVGRGHMPHIGTRNVDERGLKLIRDWIVSLEPSPDDSHQSPLLQEISRSPVTPEVQTQLNAHTNLALEFTDRIREKLKSDTVTEIALTLAESSPPHHRGLYERLIPAHQRQPRLGEQVDAAAILAHAGDAQRGEQLFLHAEGLSCRNCHRIGDHGKQVGPDLTSVARERTKEQLLESILQPSLKIDPKYATTVIETKDGRILSGIVVHRTPENLTIRDSSAKDVTLALTEVEVAIPQSKSLMPDLLVKDLTANELADLLAYLTSLKTP